MNCDVLVDIEDANITTSTISTDSLSTCYFFLLTFTLHNSTYAYLRHNSKAVNPNVSAPKLLVILLNNIWIEIKIILSNKFKLLPLPNVEDLTNLNLLVGGGANETTDIVRNAFSLLLSKDKSVSEVISSFQNDDVQHLVDQLASNTTIINSITYHQDLNELENDKSELIKYFSSN